VDELTLYWTIVAGVISAGWVVTSFIRDRASQSVERTSAIMDRLLDGDQLLIDNPDIQKYLSGNALRAEKYFAIQRSWRTTSFSRPRHTPTGS
jgi:hypothetical protein